MPNGWPQGNQAQTEGAQAPAGSPVLARPAPGKAPLSRRQIVSIVSIATSAVVTVIMLIILFWPANNDCGTDQQCFITQAGSCGQASYQHIIGGTVIAYSTDKCVVTAKVTAVDQQEPAELRAALLGKSMTCDGSSGINETLLNFPPSLDTCTGPLADTINDVKLALMLA